VACVGTYVTGAHSVKVGYQAAFQVQKKLPERRQPVELRLQQPNPIQFTLRDAPFWRAIARASTRSTSRISGPAAG
jgi:hypothetical protein